MLNKNKISLAITSVYLLISLFISKIYFNYSQDNDCYPSSVVFAVILFAFPLLSKFSEDFIINYKYKNNLSQKLSGKNENIFLSISLVIVCFVIISSMINYIVNWEMKKYSAIYTMIFEGILGFDFISIILLSIHISSFLAVAILYNNVKIIILYCL